MKLLQFRGEAGEAPGDAARAGVVRGGVLRGSEVEPLSVPVLNLVRMAARARLPLASLVEASLPAQGGAGQARLSWETLEAQGQLAAPILPEEVWGAGVTYHPSADFRDADMQAGSGIYSQVYGAERPELFFKATAARCAGPGEPIGLRGDATFTAPEPELAVVLGQGGEIIGYTLGNDVSAWSIERENPLYLPQSKIYRHCCALGPLLVTADEIRDPRALEIHCRILRGDRCRFEGSAAVRQMKREISELVDWLLRSNDLPTGTVLLTGTGIVVPPDSALAEGDVVEIRCDPIGTLRNPCALVGQPVPRGTAASSAPPG